MTVTDAATQMPRILAGAPALDRRAFPRPGSVARWFEPFHVRQAHVARGEIAAQVAAGADVVLAPTWLTHRRALEAVGESRRAQAWTTAAVRLAREAVETGMERLEGSPSTRILVAGPLPDVSARPEHGTGRLLPASASEERDIHDQAAILADTAVDLVLIERRRSFEAIERSTRVAAEIGIPVWTILPLVDTSDEPPFDERVVMTVAAGASRVLVDLDDPPDGARVTETLARIVADAGVTPGLVGDEPPLAVSDTDLDAWLGAGVGLLGILGGADPGSLTPLIDARARLRALTLERQEARQASLDAWVLDAARRAPGGRALWVGTRDIPLPPGFDWTVIDRDARTLAPLPDEAFRLIVALEVAAPESLARLVERGGIVALETAVEGAVDRLVGGGIHVQGVERTPDGRDRVVGRRERA